MVYIEEVTELFRSRCGEMKILDPMDYVMIAEWEKQEIPFIVVAAAIDEVCSRLGDGDLRIGSVSYFHDTIKHNFRAWLQTEGGTD
jgi:hypothetical protein